MIAEYRPGSVGVGVLYGRVPTAMTARPSLPPVIVDDGDVLLIRRRAEEGRLKWQFPLGRSSQASKAAVRDALEEPGLKVRTIGDLGERVHPDTGRTMLTSPARSSTARRL